MKQSRNVVRWLQELVGASRDRQRRPRGGVRLGLECLEDRWVPSTFTVTDNSDDGSDPGSLRYALSNLAAGGNTINFAISGSTTIAVSSSLPAITQQVSILGFTQGGSGYNGPPLIVLNGASVGFNVDGLSFAAGSDGSEVQGLVIQQFQFGCGIFINRASGIQVVGNFIGTDQSGTAALGNYDGVCLFQGANGNTVGGTSTGSANVISGNAHYGVDLAFGASGNVVLGNLIGTDKTGTASLGNRAGVLITAGATGNTVGGASSGSANVISGNIDGIDLGPDTTGTVIQGNFIGTDKTGTVALANTYAGVAIYSGASGNTVGGTTSGSANVISGNGLTGVYLLGSGTSNNVVLGNKIGTDVSGTASLGNGAGVLVAYGATGNTIGGTAANSGNLIAFNGKGVVVNENDTTGNSILGNSIRSNSGPGIDLGNDGLTANGANPRSFPNNGQNTPILTSASGTTVTGTLTSAASTTFRLEFFASPASGPASQGATFLGSLDVTTNASGQAFFTASVSAIPANSVVTATATNLTTGDSSEFGILTDVPTASISGVVYVDVNQNGLFDGNEPGLDGVTVELQDGSGNVLETATTVGGFYLFDGLPTGTYRIHKIQPTGVTDGPEYLGSLGGSVVANDTMQLTLNATDATDYAFAELGQQVTHGNAAGVGFWQAKNGQDLIKAGGEALANWLSANFANVFGNTFGGANATGDAVAAFYKNQLFAQTGKNAAGPAKVDAQFMAVALAAYFTDSGLAGNVAASYGFNVTDVGTGDRVVNVGTAGAAFGVSNGTTLTVMQLLQATNAQTDTSNHVTGFAYLYDTNGDGVISADEANLRTLANGVYSFINMSGGI
jgi:hypothetical protein